MPELVIFEQPLNERCRTLLRLSQLFAQLNHHLPLGTEWDSRAAMTALLSIGAVLSRGDIKSDLIKEMERQTVNLGRMRESRGVDRGALEQILTDLDRSINELHGDSGQLGHHIRSDDFLKAIQQRSSIPGGDCAFDLPGYYQWLTRPASSRQADLRDWQRDLDPLQRAVELLLSLIRGSSHPSHEVAERGFFQRNLGSQLSAQMIRVALPTDSGMMAEVSGGKHRFSVRFLTSEDLSHPCQVQEDVPFQLTTCII